MLVDPELDAETAVQPLQALDRASPDRADDGRHRRAHVVAQDVERRALEHPGRRRRGRPHRRRAAPVGEQRQLADDLPRRHLRDAPRRAAGHVQQRLELPALVELHRIAEIGEHSTHAPDCTGERPYLVVR